VLESKNQASSRQFHAISYAEIFIGMHGTFGSLFD
jgi:hypothetical protein